MRAAIYVYATTSFEVDHPIQSHPRAQTVLDGKTTIPNVTLQPGIYKIHTRGLVVPKITPSSGSTFDVMLIEDKDPVPDPPNLFTATFTDVTSNDLRAFFPTAVGDKPSPI
jgi:hypothetical protein